MSIRRYISASQASSKLVKYGALYNWYAAQGTGLSSITRTDEWIVPTYTNLTADLIGYLVSNAGTKLKEAGTTYWQSGNTGTDILNFHFRGGGQRKTSFVQFNQIGVIWTSTPYDTSNAWRCYTAYAQTVWNTGADLKYYGNSIRLCRNASSYEQTLADGTACTPYVGNDGTSYPTVKIGVLVWMASNLAETKFRDGSSISNVTDNTAWTNLTTPAMCYYNNDINNAFI